MLLCMSVVHSFFKYIYLFIFGCIGSSLLRVGFSWGEWELLLVVVRWLLLLRNMGSRCTGFSSCGTWAQQLRLVGSRAQSQQLWRTGLVAPWHVGSCIGRRILNHCATREALHSFFKLLSRDFLGGPAVKNPPYNARDMGLIPGQGTKIPQAAGQLSPHATTTELARLNQRACVLQTTESTRSNPHATTTEPMRPGACVPQLKRKPARRNQREARAAATKDPACLNRDRMCRNYNPTQPKININK